MQWYLDHDCVALMEVPQGLELSLDSRHYPYVTSRNIDISSALSNAMVHPYYLGKVAVIIRTLPIRVGNIINKDNIIIGESGPVYEDMSELSWDDIGINPEKTTVTNRNRRIFSFSMRQYKYMLNRLRPDYILLNFANYLNNIQLKTLLELTPEITHIGFGASPDRIYCNHIFQ
ncbi:MAG: adenylosuccinate synthetase [Vampirovibrionia bacterium]